ncbi:MAG: hypothetical protein KC501_26395, partial [Myxococcales bacterium]|nr:hypothetical protein [Myxococcales bacterium]
PVPGVRPAVPVVSPPPAVAKPPDATPAPRKFSLPPLGRDRAAPAVSREAGVEPPRASSRMGAPSFVPPSRAPSSVAPPPAGLPDLPPPPEYAPYASSAEVPLELLDGPAPDELDVDVDTSGSNPAIATRDLEPGDELDIDVETSATALRAEPWPVGDELDIDLDTSGSSPAIPARELEAGDELDIDVEASATALPSAPRTGEDELDIDLDTSGSSSAIAARDLEDDDDDAGISSVEVANWKATGPVEEVVRDRAPTGASPMVAPRRAVPFADVLPSTPARPKWPWLAGGTAAVLGVVALLLLGSGDEPKDETAKATEVGATADAKAPKGSAKAGPQAEDADEPSVADAGASPGAEADAPPEAEAGDAAVVVAVADDGDATDEGPVPAVDDAPSPAPTTPSSAGPSAAYLAAAAEHEATGSSDSLLAMILAACADDDGALARESMRKLKGKDQRSEAIITCRKRGVDVLANVKSYTGPEYLRRAQRAMEAGDAAKALELARASNKVERSGGATSLMTLAACILGDAEEARRMLPHVPKKRRPEVIEQCTAKGIALGP